MAITQFGVYNRNISNSLIIKHKQQKHVLRKMNTRSGKRDTDNGISRYRLLWSTSFLNTFAKFLYHSIFSFFIHFVIFFIFVWWETHKAYNLLFLCWNETEICEHFDRFSDDINFLKKAFTLITDQCFYQMYTCQRRIPSCAV